MAYDREPKYLHPYITARLQTILNAVNAKLPVGHTAKLISAYRTPADQFALFKQGRTFKDGAWIKTGPVVTNLDGFIKLSRHNYLPCTAFDTGIFNGNTYLGDSPLYKHVKEGVKFGMDWGGDWNTFKDQPHLEMPTGNFFKSNIKKDSGLVWQKYLVKSGTYTGVLDGIFGPKSVEALKAATGEVERNMTAWDKLYDRHGVLEESIATITDLGISDFNSISMLDNIGEERPRPEPVLRPRPEPVLRPRPKPERRPRPKLERRPKPGSN